MPKDEDKDVAPEEGQSVENENSPEESAVEKQEKNSGDENTSSSETEFIKLRVVGADQNEILFKIKTTTQMYKLKNSYSLRMGIPVNSLRFLFDGKRISDDETPKQLEMKNGDMLEVYQEQVGGYIEMV